jgi:MFS family permease
MNEPDSATTQAQPQAPLDTLAGSLAAGKQAVESAYGKADQILDTGQHHVFRLFYLFLPETTVLRRRRFQGVMASRFLSDAAQQSLAYGAIVAIVRDGGTAFEAALIGVAAVVPPTLFGLYGGAIADALPRRVALAGVYNLQAALCFFLPLFTGDGLLGAMLLLLGVHTLGQVSGPTESAVVPYVASRGELASAASLLSLASNLGTAFGTALLAPVIVRALDPQALFIAAGILLLLAATRVFDLRTRDEPKTSVEDIRLPRVPLRATIGWLAAERAVGTMIILAALAGTANVVLATLAPRYVQEVLGVDPADAVFVFGPTVIGLGAALVLSPPLIRRFGERMVGLAGFATLAASLSALGLVGEFAATIDPVNPIGLLGAAGIDISRDLRTAGFIAIFAGFGLSLATTATLTYVNRRVPLDYQARAFALQSVLKNGTSIIPLLTFGAAAAAFGVEPVLVVAPFILLLLATGLIRLSAAVAGHEQPGRLEVLSSFWEQSDHEPVELPPEVETPAESDPPRPEERRDDEHAGAEHRSDDDALRRAGADEHPPL